MATIKEQIAIACADGKKYHLSKQIVQDIRGGKRFRYWQGVLDLAIPEQLAFYEDIRSNDLISNFATIKHDKDVHEDGTPVREHVHMFLQSVTDLTYSNMLKKTGFDCIVLIPSTKANMSKWLDYVCDHDGKVEYSTDCVDFSTTDFSKLFLGDVQSMRELNNSERIAIINSAMNQIEEVFDGVKMPKQAVYDMLGADPVTAQVFNYPLLFRCFVEQRIEDHDTRVTREAKLPPIWNTDQLAYALKRGELPKAFLDMMYQFCFTGQVAQPDHGLDDYLISLEEPEPIYYDLEEALEAFKDI